MPRSNFHAIAASRRLFVSAGLALIVGIGVIAASTQRLDRPAPTTSELIAFAPAPALPAREDLPADPLPVGAKAELGSRRLQDVSIDRAPTFSPDGKYLATGGANVPICVWETATGKLVRTHANQGSVYDLRWRQDGKLAALTFSGHDEFLMQEFGPDDMGNADPGERERVPDSAKRDRLKDRFLSAGGQWVVGIWTNEEKPGRRADLYKFTTGHTPYSITARRQVDLPSGEGVWLSADAKFLIAQAAATNGQPAKLLAFDLTTDKPDKQAWDVALAGDDNHRPACCFSPDGKRVVILFWDDKVELWDGPAGKRIRELPPLPKFNHHNNNEWWGIDVTPDGKRLALVHRQPNGEVGGRIVDVESGKDITTLTPQPMPWTSVIRLSADGQRLAQVSGGTIRIWNAQSGADACPLPGHRGSVNSVALNANGKTVITAGEDQTVRAWDPLTRKEIWRTSLPQAVRVKFATPAGIVVEEYNEFPDSVTTLLDSATGKAGPLPGKLGKAQQDCPLAISPDGKKFVTLERRTRPVERIERGIEGQGQEGALRVWSWPAGELLATTPLTLPNNFAFSRCVAGHFTPDGKQFVAVVMYADPAEQQTHRSVPDHSFVERWDLATGKLLQRIAGTNKVVPLLIPHKSALFFVLDRQVFDAGTGQAVVKLQNTTAEPLYSKRPDAAAISPDGQTLALGNQSGGRIVLTEMRTGKQRGRFSISERELSGLYFLPDGRLASTGRSVILWITRLQPATVPAAETELLKCWDQLTDANPKIAYLAMSQLAGAPAGSCDLFRRQVRVVPKITDAVMATIFQNLDADRFRDREAASQELDNLGLAAVARVKDRLANGAAVSEELKARLTKFLAKHHSTEMTAEELRTLRAVEVLETIAAPEARQLLHDWAEGDRSVRLTQDSAAALCRLEAMNP